MFIDKTKMKIEKTQYIVPVTISPWLRALLVDPISKMPFTEQTADSFKAPCGFLYRYRDGVPDFRVKMTISAQEWLAGQIAFESWIDDYFNNGEADATFYKREQARDRPMYEAMKLSGRVLDVGGQLGHIRKYMNSDQEYCSIDPFIEVHVRARNRKNLFANYPVASRLTARQVELSWCYADVFFNDWPKPFPWSVGRKFWSDLKEWPISRMVAGRRGKVRRHFEGLGGKID